MFMYVLCRYKCVCTKCSKGVFYSLAMHGTLICHSQNDIIEVNQNTLDLETTLSVSHSLWWVWGLAAIYDGGKIDWYDWYKGNILKQHRGVSRDAMA